MKKRKILSDPEEFALIKEIYFYKDLPNNEDIDPIEKLERIESKQKNNNISPR